jgi:hypothetical protein
MSLSGDQSDVFASIRLLFGGRPARTNGEEPFAKDKTNGQGPAVYRKRDINDLLREAVVWPHHLITHDDSNLLISQDTNNDLVLDGFDHMTALDFKNSETITLYTRQFASVLLSAMSLPPPVAADVFQPFSDFVILHKPITLQHPSSNRRFELGGEFLETALRRYTAPGNDEHRTVLRMAGLVYHGDRYSVFYVCPRTRYVTCVLWPIQLSSRSEDNRILGQVCDIVATSDIARNKSVMSGTANSSSPPGRSTLNR